MQRHDRRQVGPRAPEVREPQLAAVTLVDDLHDVADPRLDALLVAECHDTIAGPTTYPPVAPPMSTSVAALARPGRCGAAGGPFELSDGALVGGAETVRDYLKGIGAVHRWLARLFPQRPVNR